MTFFVQTNWKKMFLVLNKVSQSFKWLQSMHNITNFNNIKYTSQRGSGQLYFLLVSKQLQQLNNSTGNNILCLKNVALTPSICRLNILVKSSLSIYTYMYLPLQVMFAITLLTPELKTFIYFFHFNLSITYKEQTTALSLVSEKHYMTLFQTYTVLPKKNNNNFILSYCQTME